MTFQIDGRVAVITGGVSGLGFGFAKELLRNGLKGVTLADINDSASQNALDEIENEFGPNKAIYIHVDVSNKAEFEGVFKKTLEVFKNIDILINSAGIFNDSAWEREIEINLNGTINGVLLGFENYIPKYKYGDEGLIVNISSIAALEVIPGIPMYTATKIAVLGIGRVFGHREHYERTKVKVITVCPGATDTPLLRGSANGPMGPVFKAMMERYKPAFQELEYATTGLIKIIKKAKEGAVWVTEGREEPYEVEFPERIGIRKQN